MAYTPEKWIPRPKINDVFRIELDNLEDLRIMLGATSVRTAYIRGSAVLVEWTMMHRETFSGNVGQYIVRDDLGRMKVVDKNELRADYEPHIEGSMASSKVDQHPEIGRLVAVETRDGSFTEVLFKLPNGDPISFIPKPVESVVVVDLEKEVVDEDAAKHFIENPPWDDPPLQKPAPEVHINNSRPNNAPNPGNMNRNKERQRG